MVGQIVTMCKELFKCFLREAQLKVCGAIIKEIGAEMAARFMKTQQPYHQAPDQIRRSGNSVTCDPAFDAFVVGTVGTDRRPSERRTGRTPQS